MYAESDGHCVVLTTRDGLDPANTIRLEPEVMSALLSFWQSLGCQPPADLLDQLSKRHRRLLNLLWQRERMTWAELALNGWPERDGGNTEANARTEFNRLRESLRKAGRPTLVDHKGGSLWVNKPENRTEIEQK